MSASLSSSLLKKNTVHVGVSLFVVARDDVDEFAHFVVVKECDEDILQFRLLVFTHELLDYLEAAFVIGKLSACLGASQTMPVNNSVQSAVDVSERHAIV